MARRDAFAEVDDDGTGTLTVTGCTSSVVAAMDRIDSLSRAVRASGDPRTLAQLRSDLALSLLIHGTTTPAAGPGPGSTVAADGVPVAEVDRAIARVLDAEPVANLEVIVPLEVLLNPDSCGIRMVPGRGYLSAEQVRDLAARAGGVLHRLVTDPLDGRVVERSVTSYRPDAAMRDQVTAADRHCRSPGCSQPVSRCELDHEVPYVDGVTGGPTSERNLGLKHGRHHQLKTWQAWTTSMDATRNVTWQTLFGRCYRTRAHDYRVYTHPWDRTGDQGQRDRALQDWDLRARDL